MYIQYKYGARRAEPTVPRLSSETDPKGWEVENRVTSCAIVTVVAVPLSKGQTLLRNSIAKYIDHRVSRGRRLILCEAANHD